MTALLSPSEISEEWRAMLLDIPGYDSIATAGECRFDEAEACKALEFFPRCLRHVEGALSGQPFTLERWQQAIIANLFGWKRLHRKHGWIRRYREVLILCSRKQGKSPLAAGIALFMLFCDPMPGKQCYLAAADREQASIVYRHCKGMIQQEPLLAKRCRIYGGTANAYQSRTIVREEEGSFLRVVSADADSKHGGNTHLAVIDELHAQPDRELVDVFTTSMASENIPQPMLVYITSADYNRTSICNEKHDYAIKVRDGKADDLAFLPVVYEVEMEADWTDPEVWRRANPNLGVSVSLDYLERECKKAQEIPAYENTFRRLHLSQRTQQDVRAIPMEQWDACGDGADPKEWRARMLVALRTKKCAGGLDLGSVSDLTALALLFGDYQAGYDVLPFFWCPGDTATMRSRRDGVDYVQWARAGFITLTEGNETDYTRVRTDIGVLGNQYGIYEMAADRLFQGAQLCQNLIQDGFNIKAMGQGYVSMAAPTRALLELVAGGRLRHGNNPVLRWMAENAATESDSGPADTVLKFSKKKSTEKIDGIIAVCEALAVSMLAPEVSVYSRRGVIDIGNENESDREAVAVGDVQDDWFSDGDT